ncbi:hypothetical protein Ahy_B03g067025 isoform A [Arachis hypogaea]|uniref:Uncharacterized protein n=1 Tax=Arachis hypogaea TaxID=3818 RepID=A0A445A5T3_ARAHY|nr:hypothetical protein Ahy_B03g067025 isoform A [Arachis hypogaea]
MTSNNTDYRTSAPQRHGVCDHHRSLSTTAPWVPHMLLTMASVERSLTRREQPEQTKKPSAGDREIGQLANREEMSPKKHEKSPKLRGNECEK